MKNTLLPILLGAFLFLSCKKTATLTPSLIESSIIPFSMGNWWKYKFYARLKDSSYSLIAVEAVISSGEKKTLTNGKDAVQLITKLPSYSDTSYVLKESNDLTFYYKDGREFFRLAEPLLLGKSWISIDDSVKVITMENLNVPAGSFPGTFNITQKYIFFICCQYHSFDTNSYWIKPGIGVIKQDIFAYSNAFPNYNPNPKDGRYELDSYYINH